MSAMVASIIFHYSFPLYWYYIDLYISMQGTHHMQTHCNKGVHKVIRKSMNPTVHLNIHQNGM